MIFETFKPYSLLLLLALNPLASDCVPLTSWFTSIQASFTNTSFPLKRCFKRRNVAPMDMQVCGPKPKTCFFGDQVCDSDPYPTERCVCDGSRDAIGHWVCEPEPCPTCRNAAVTEAPWTDIDGFSCTGYQGYCNLTSCPICTQFINFGLTAPEVCCICGGGGVSDAGICNDLIATLPEPLPWTDSVGSDCSFYEEDPQTRCVDFANEFNTEFGLTLREACCACRDIEPPTADGCVDLQGWTTALNRSGFVIETIPQGRKTCAELTRAECGPIINTENFGIAASEACCKCGGGSRNPSLPTSFDPTVTETFTAGICESDNTRFNMCIKMSPNFAPQDVALVDAAASRWASVIVGDSPEFVYDFDIVNNTDTGFGFIPPRNASNLDAFYTFLCGFDPGFPVNSTDDINICGSVRRLSSSNTIAQAGVIFGDNFPRFSTFEMNADIVRSTRSVGDQLGGTILHELAHSLGQGTLYDIESPGPLVANISNCTYLGEAANQVFKESTGCNSTLPLEFDLELDIDTFTFIATCGIHLDEFCFQAELMTPTTENATFSPLSVYTIAMMEDLGYTVDYSQADPFTINPECLCPNITNTSVPEPAPVSAAPVDQSTDRRLQHEGVIRGMSQPNAPDMDKDVMMEIIMSAREDLQIMNKYLQEYMDLTGETNVVIPGLNVLYADNAGRLRDVYVRLE